jgi:hypothetical protein
MAAPPTPGRKRPPAWVTWGGLLLGALALLPFLPWEALLRPPKAGGLTGSGITSFMFAVGFLMVGIGLGLVISATFGLWAARGSWAWATRPSHPWLTRCETWAPLHGRWLQMAAAFGLWLLIWSAEWATFIGLLLWPSMPPTFQGLFGVVVIAWLGYLSALLALRSTERSVGWNDPPPGPGEPETECRSG